MDDFEGWALASLERAAVRWQEGRIDMFVHHIEMAFTLLEKHKRHQASLTYYCPYCKTDTLSTRGAMWIRCNRCERSYLEAWENWIDEDDVIW